MAALSLVPGMPLGWGRLGTRCTMAASPAVRCDRGGDELRSVSGGMMIHESKDQLSSSPAAHQGVGLLPLLG